MKKWYRNKLLIALAIIPAIVIMAITIFRTFSLPAQPTKEEYTLLKDCNLQIASGIPVEKVEQNEVEVVRLYISDSYLEIVTQNERCEIVAKYPISKDVVMENGKIYHNIEYDKAMYREESRIETKFKCILSGFGAAILWVCIFLILFWSIPKEYRKTLNEEKKKN